MALTKDFNFSHEAFDVSVKNAYLKVESVISSKEEAVAKLGVRKSKDLEPVRVMSYKFLPDLNGANFIQQAYQHIKSLPEFAGAQDC
jgi:hypothetical protein